MDEQGGIEAGRQVGIGVFVHAGLALGRSEKSRTGLFCLCL